ncbi:hypothetical protein [Clostridium oceanicum]|uniref:Uncharacterized protein n=1 Tax=Clostridium oceanicum TaxID=1543 RepID=A0ABP3UQ87_9CLOT
MKKNSYINVLVFITAYITTRVIYRFTGFSYSFSEGLSTKLLIDLSLWAISYIIINIIVRKIVLPKINTES